jgi:flagellar basal body P-ring formation protein FlgA
MKQASNSLLTLCPIPFKAKLCSPTLFRDGARAAGRFFTPFHVCQESSLKTSFSVLLVSCPLRSFVRSRLGEGRIRGLLSSVICLIAFAVLLRPASSAEHNIVKLKNQVIVQSNGIILKDVADLQGTDAKQLEKLAQIPLGAAPHPGVVATLSRYQITNFIQKAVGSILEIEFTGAEIVQIRLQGRPLESEEIVSCIKSYLIQNTPWKESEIEIQSIEHPQGIELPPGDSQLRISSRLPVTGRGRIIFPFEIVQDGKIQQYFWTTTKIRINAGILTAAKSIPPGKVVDLEDVVLSAATIGDLHAAYLQTPDEIVGKISQRNISPGDPLTRDAFKNPIVIKRGETIHLRLQRSGIVLTALGRAEQDGRLGQMIKVRNLEFSTSLNAEITGPGEAKVQ